MIRKLVPTFVLAAMLASTKAALALPDWMSEGKSGRFMFNLKPGPAITAKAPVDGDPKPTMGALVLDFGFAVDHVRNAYLLFSLQFQLHDKGNAVIVPFGFQYDIPIHKVPGLYITPRLMLGYAAIIPNVQGANNIDSAFLEFGAGAKFVFAKRWNVGFEPFGLSVFLADGSQIPNSTSSVYSAISYRLLFYGGVNF
jgi:hypothetical protein